MVAASVLDISDADQREIFQQAELYDRDYHDYLFRYERVCDFVYIKRTPSWQHQETVGMLTAQIGNYLKGKAYRVYPLNTRLNWTTYIDKLKNVRALDGFFMSDAEAEKDGIVLDPDAMVLCKHEHWGCEGYQGVPKLIAEVLGKQTAMNDKGWKKDIYEALGVAEYWIVDIIKRFEAVRYNLEDGKYVEKIFPFVKKPYLAHSSIFPELVLDFSKIELPDFDNSGHLF
jgi:Uma2 family endonuclease